VFVVCVRNDMQGDMALVKCIIYDMGTVSGL